MIAPIRPTPHDPPTIDDLMAEAEKYIHGRAARVWIPSYDPADVRQELRIIALAAAKLYDPACGVPWPAYLCRRLSFGAIDLMRARGAVRRDGRIQNQPHISLESSLDDQRADLWEPADEGDDHQSVDWQDLVDVAASEPLQVRALVLRSGGLTMREIAERAGVSDAWICKTLKTSHPQYTDSLHRVRQLIGREDEPMPCDRWRDPPSEEEENHGARLMRTA